MDSNNENKYFDELYDIVLNLFHECSGRTYPKKDIMYEQDKKRAIQDVYDYLSLGFFTCEANSIIRKPFLDSAIGAALMLYEGYFKEDFLLSKMEECYPLQCVPSLDELDENEIIQEIIKCLRTNTRAEVPDVKYEKGLIY